MDKNKMDRNYFLKRYYERFDEGDNKSVKMNLLYFFVGLGLLSAGIFLIFQNTRVSSGFTLADIIGFTPPFGLVLLPLLLGIGVLFFNEKSIIGWVLTIFGIVTILLGILMGLRIQFLPVSLYETILMFGMTAAGAGLFLKALYDKRRK